MKTILKICYRVPVPLKDKVRCTSATTVQDNGIHIVAVKENNHRRDAYRSILPNTWHLTITSWQRRRLHVLCGCSKSHQVHTPPGAYMRLMLQGNNEIYPLALSHVLVLSWCFQRRGMRVMLSVAGNHATTSRGVRQQQRSNWYW